MLNAVQIMALFAVAIILVILALNAWAKKQEEKKYRQGEKDILRDSAIYDKKIIDGRRRAEKVFRLKKLLGL